MGVNFNLSPADGLKTIYFKVKNVMGESATASVKVTLKTVPEKLEANMRSHVSAMISPNPVKSNVKVSISKTPLNTNQIIAADEDMYDVKLYDVTGKLIEQSQQFGNEFSLDMTHFLNGMYFLKMNGAKNSFTKTIVKN